MTDVTEFHTTLRSSFPIAHQFASRVIAVIERLGAGTRSAGRMLVQLPQSYSSAYMMVFFPDRKTLEKQRDLSDY